jgi:hypothetical protein
MHDDETRLPGFYLVIRVTDCGPRLVVSEWAWGEWYHTGVEAAQTDVSEVITRFDLEAIEMAARNQL